MSLVLVWFEAHPAASSTGISVSSTDLYCKEFGRCDCTVLCVREERLMQAQRLRRARLYDRASQAWVIIRPGQTWEDGEVCQPPQTLLACLFAAVVHPLPVAAASLVLPVVLPYLHPWWHCLDCSRGVGGIAARTGDRHSKRARAASPGGAVHILVVDASHGPVAGPRPGPVGARRLWPSSRFQ